MAHYSSIIFVLLQLLRVHCDDLNSNYIYQKLLTTRFRSQVPNVSHHLPIRKKSIELYSNILFQPEITSTSARNNLQDFDSNYSKKIQENTRVSADFYRRQKAMQEATQEAIQKYYGDSCLYKTGTKRCGSYSDRHKQRSYSRNTAGGGATVPVGFILVALYLVYCLLCGICCWGCNMYCDRNTDRSNNLAINNHFNQQMSQISIEPTSTRMNSMTQLHLIENHSLPFGGAQRLIRTTPLINSIVSTEPQLSENNDSNGRRAMATLAEQHTSSSLPTYDSIMRQSSETITIEQQSLLPPSYNDFMRRNNDRDETTSL